MEARQERVRCCFSVKYYHPAFPDEVWAADWQFLDAGWSRSWREVGGLRWNTERGIDEFARRAILKKFGLENWEKDFPEAVIIKLSPRKLAEIRRQKEKEFNLDYLEILSDTMGDPSPAEDFD